jgi:cell division protein FtsZ
MNITCSSDLTLDEMTEASDRIHQEVGDDAEIIWGQAIDESLGDEMRVTVIATGIGGSNERQAKNVHSIDSARPKARTSSSRAALQEDSFARGQVREPTPEELENWNEAEEPVMVRQKKVVGQDGRNAYRGIPLDTENLEIPTFLRRQAD